ncbi:MAG: deaminase [Patescibacteria group bacterium]|jgi:tRNA(Arg) A34 adenosine deaminase TadA
MKELNSFDQKCLETAIGSAREACLAGDYPVGAVLAIDNEIIAVGGNEYNKNKPEKRSYVNHAENLLIIKQGNLLADAYKQGKIISLYSTLEPCIQCLGASVSNHINRILYIEPDPNGGACNLRHDNIGVWYKEVWPEIIQCSISEEPRELMIKFFHEETARGDVGWPQKMLRLLNVS